MTRSRFEGAPRIEKAATKRSRRRRQRLKSGAIVLRNLDVDTFTLTKLVERGLLDPAKRNDAEAVRAALACLVNKTLEAPPVQQFIDPALVQHFIARGLLRPEDAGNIAAVLATIQQLAVAFLAYDEEEKIRQRGLIAARMAVEALKRNGVA